MPEISRDEFLAFARSMPADERYDFMSNENCALAQFGKFKHPGHDIYAGGGYYEVYGEERYGAPWLYTYPERAFPINLLGRRHKNADGFGPETWGNLVRAMEAQNGK